MSDDMFSIDAVLSKHVKKPVPNAKPREILLYSKPGSGKTHLAGTAVDLSTVKKGLYIDTEGSTEGVIKNPKWDILKVYEYPSAERVEQLAKARNVDPSEIDQREERFKFFNTILGSGKNGLFNRANKTAYDVIVVDTLDAAQDWAQDYFLDGPGAHLTRSGEVDTRAGWRNISA